MFDFRKNYPKLLLGIFAVFWLIMCLKPSYWNVWLVENITTFIILGVVILTFHKFRFSNASYTFIFIYLVLHVIGAHYSYTEMPLFNIIKEQLSLSRNNYDRVLHFLFGALFYYPFYEFATRKLNIRNAWAHTITIAFVVAIGSLYEIFEYLSVVARNSQQLSTYFLGEQGDYWDTQKDMLLNSLGAFVACGINIFYKRIYRTKH